MSEFYQSGQHPDADQLSAFAEDALPAHEREQTLAHLAGCTDCRMIVSLSLPHVEDAPQLQTVVARKPWSYGWNVAWLAGAGLAALIFFTLHIHNSGHDGKIAGTLTQTAAVHTAASPQAAPMEPTVTNAAPTPVRKAVPAVAALRSPDTVEALKNPSVGATMDGRQIATLPVRGRNFIVQPQQQQLTQQQQSQQQAGALHGFVFGDAAGGRVARDDRSPFAQRSAPNENNKEAASANAAAPVAAPPLNSAQVQQAPAAAAKSAPQTSDTVTVDAGAMGMETTNASASTILPSGAPVNVHRLPSHLAIASTIARAKQILAVDTAGALFLSNDGGSHWKAVAAQWPGRAVKVELASQPMVPAKQPASNFMNDRDDNTSSLSGFDLKPVSAPSVIGVVTDPSGAIIPGVSIRVTDSRTGVTRPTMSDRSGRYVVDGLAPDAYRIDASAPGFQSWRGTVTLAATQRSAMNIKLMVGAATETVEVSSQATMMTDKAKKTTRRAAQKAYLSEPFAVFEITTDSGELWTSTDGKNWVKGR